MKALVYHGPGQKAWEDKPDPSILSDTDVIVRVDAVTICREGRAAVASW
jgi:alcohol dehydrogenase